MTTADTLLSLGSATVGESGARVMHPRIRAAWPGARLAAPAYPVTCGPADNLAIHVAAAEAPEGWALVVDASRPPGRGYWGEVLTTAAESRHLAGLVIDGGVRDLSALEAHQFPVFSALVALQGALKVGGGAVGHPAMVGDTTVERGDWVVGDPDGVAVIPAAMLEEVITAARARADKEVRLFEALRGGANTLELLGLDPAPVTRRPPD